LQSDPPPKRIHIVFVVPMTAIGKPRPRAEAPAMRCLPCWVNRRQGHETVLHDEPEVDFWRKLSSRMLGLLIPSDWL